MAENKITVEQMEQKNLPTLVHELISARYSKCVIERGVGSHSELCDISSSESICRFVYQATEEAFREIFEPAGYLASIAPAVVNGSHGLSLHLSDNQETHPISKLFGYNLCASYDLYLGSLISSHIGPKAVFKGLSLDDSNVLMHMDHIGEVVDLAHKTFILDTEEREKLLTTISKYLDQFSLEDQQKLQHCIDKMTGYRHSSNKGSLKTPWCLISDPNWRKQYFAAVAELRARVFGEEEVPA